MPVWIIGLLYFLLAVGVFVALVQNIFEFSSFRRANIHGIFVVTVVLGGLIALLDVMVDGDETDDLAALIVGFGLPSLRHLARSRVAQAALPRASRLIRFLAGPGIHVVAALAAASLATSDVGASGIFFIAYLLVIADERLRPPLCCSP
ncbi:hypothetical protein [Nocardioides sp.]|uniref:hypothetical protein n=1 Tax=Nocardioides sp. TaxID=35761 RepID=UPI002CA84FD6|nr:hypothetical protein [Nocardioides sp.]HXH77412.1 hypothetical protein [Nocardioides sp.]